MAELADALDLGSCGQPCGFKSHYPYQSGRHLLFADAFLILSAWDAARLHRRLFRPSGLYDVFLTALWAGQLNLANVARHTAERAAGAFDVFMRLVRAAGFRTPQGGLLRTPPLQKPGILGAAFFQIAREHTEEQIHAQKERGIVDKDAKRLVGHQSGQQAERQLGDKQRPAELIHAVSAIHEARGGAAEFIEEILQD